MMDELVPGEASQVSHKALITKRITRRLEVSPHGLPHGEVVVAHAAAEGGLKKAGRRGAKWEQSCPG